jgi:hypothetical protein
MSTPREQLKQIIQELVQEELTALEEMSVTGNVAGYNTALAFRGNVPTNTARMKRIAQQLGWRLTHRGARELGKGADTLHEGGDPYYAYRADESASSRQKIAKAISELNRNILQVERALRMNERLQKESGIASEGLYRRTQEGLLKLETRLLHLAGKVREIRGK